LGIVDRPAAETPPATSIVGRNAHAAPIRALAAG